MIHFYMHILKNNERMEAGSGNAPGAVVALSLPCAFFLQKKAGPY